MGFNPDIGNRHYDIKLIKIKIKDIKFAYTIDRHNLFIEVPL